MKFIHQSKLSRFLIFFLITFTIKCFGQTTSSPNLSLKVVGGNNIFTRSFFFDTTSLNIPNTAFLTVGLSTNLFEKNNKSLFLGLEGEILNTFSRMDEKSTLAFGSLLVGRTRRYDFEPEQIYLKQTFGIAISSLLESTSSDISIQSYKGTPLQNLNLGFFNSLQLYVASENKSKSYMGYGLGLDFALKGINLFKDGNYPAFLINNLILQVGVSLGMDYNF